MLRYFLAGGAAMDQQGSVFWDDLARDLQDPEFLREYVAESIRIATIDRIVNELDEARAAAGLTKAGLARAISSEPATVRRLFSSGHVNPTLGTLAEVAAALGMRVVLEPLDAVDREQITRPLLEGGTGDPRALAARAGELRRRRPVALAASCPLRAVQARDRGFRPRYSRPRSRTRL
jgi:DNA-binding phage protein